MSHPIPDFYAALDLWPDAPPSRLIEALQARLEGAATPEERREWLDVADLLLDPARRAAYNKQLQAQAVGHHVGDAPLHAVHQGDYYTELGLPPEVGDDLLAATLASRLATAAPDEVAYWREAQEILLDPAGRASYDRLIGVAPPVRQSPPRMIAAPAALAPLDEAEDDLAPPPLPSIWDDLLWLGRLMIFPIILIPGLWVWWQVSEMAVPSIASFLQKLVYFQNHPQADWFLGPGLFWSIFLVPSFLFFLLLWLLWDAVKS